MGHLFPRVGLCGYYDDYRHAKFVLSFMFSTGYHTGQQICCDKAELQALINLRTTANRC